MSAIKLSTPSSGSISLSPANTASNLTITVPAVSATMATLTTPSFATTIGVGGATPATSGAGITFPATKSPSSDANTLDDYEEGTWEPDIRPQSGSFSSVTYNGDTGGKYIKIGQLVYLTGTVRWTAISVGSGSSSVFIGNLPFVCASRTNGDNADAPGITNTFVWNGSGTNVPTSVRMVHTSALLYMLTQTGSAVVNDVDVGDIGSTGMVTFAIVMYTN